VTYYVTTPIYYVNAQPHLGHAYTTIAADVLARHMRQRGEEVFFLTGTDEHGEPVAQAAEREGTSPRELADKNAARFLELAGLVDATNDFFIRTSDERHVARVQEVLQRVYDRGYVYEGVYEGWYCPRCADFKTDAELEDGNRCPIHKIELTREREDNYFFKLSEFQEPLERLYEERPDWIVPRVRYNEALSFIRSGLHDVSLTRGKLTWGVPVPWDEGHVFYVWFDALLNYYTALGFAREGEDLTERFWPADVHLIGKDILKFHAVFWPALLMAAGLEVPRRLCIHGYLLMDEHKMSKSLGNVIDPFQVAEVYGVDALRYYLFASVGFGQDGNISPADLEARYTSELANEYGNLASRTLAMVRKYNSGIVPAMLPSRELERLFGDTVDRVRESFDRVEISAALERTWELVRALNRYVQEQAPWQLAKDPDKGMHLDSVLTSLIEGLRVVSILLHPFMPDATMKLLTALGCENETSLSDAGFGMREWGTMGGELGELAPLFPRIEQPQSA
jgi:methionyl-tRNA synthetase